MNSAQRATAILGFLGVILSLSANAQTKANRTKSVRATGQSTLAAPAVKQPAASITVEPKLGFTYMGMTGSAAKQKIEGTDQRFEVNSDAGYSAGVGISIPLTPSFSFETGLHYIQTNAETNRISVSENDGGTSLSYEMKMDIRLEHLAVPALGRYCFSGCAASGVFLRGGVIPTYLTGGRARGDYTVSASSGGFNYKDSGRSSARISDEDFTGLNALGLAGAGFRIQMNPAMALEFDANYARGLFKMAGGGSEKLYHHGLWTGALLSIAL